MDYQAVRKIFFVDPVPGAPAPGPFASGAPARRLRDAIEPIACVSIWSEEAAEGYVDKGLDDFFAAYIWQRVAAMGTPPAPLAVVGMGVYDPGVISALYEQAVAALPHADVVAIRQAGPGVTLRRHLGDVDAEAAPVVAALRRGVDAADLVARPMFAGLRAEPWPADGLAQLVHACHLLREHRGDTHMAVSMVAGFDPVEMNHLTALWCGHQPLGYTGTRGWSEQDMTDALDRLRVHGLVDGDRLSAAGLAARTAMETQTDMLQQPIIEAIGPDLEPCITALNAWSAAIIDAGGSPADPAKRASG